MHNSHFEQFSLNKHILRALSEEGYSKPTDVQQAAIPEAMAGKDFLATAQTGTGKTAVFAMPILHLLHEQRRHAKGIRALILTPTRELALQIDLSFRTYGRYLPLRSTVVVGGVPSVPQIKALKNNPDILVGTPGRLQDLINQGHIRLDRIEMLVIDEADRMLDMGFIREVRRIVSTLPRARQTMFLSATLPAAIADLASDMLRNPTMVEVTPAATVSLNIAQKVLFVERTQKRELLTDVLKDKSVRRALVFTRTKHRADHVMRHLANADISVSAIHSNKSQREREKALSAFDRGKIRVLVATDIVARGIDVEGISHVINYELPNDPESYVHRIGRTARAGAAGIALSFCDFEEVPMLRGIERLTRHSLAAFEDHPYHSASIAALSRGKPAPSGLSSGRRFQRRSSSRRRTGRRAM